MHFDYWTLTFWQILLYEEWFSYHREKKELGRRPWMHLASPYLQYFFHKCFKQIKTALCEYPHGRLTERPKRMLYVGLSRNTHKINRKPETGCDKLPRTGTFKTGQTAHGYYHITLKPKVLTLNLSVSTVSPFVHSLQCNARTRGTTEKEKSRAITCKNLWHYRRVLARLKKKKTLAKKKKKKQWTPSPATRVMIKRPSSFLIHCPHKHTQHLSPVRDSACDCHAFKIQGKSLWLVTLKWLRLCLTV